MDRIWIFIALTSIFVSVGALQINGESFPDYWQNDEDYEWYSDELEKLGIFSTGAKELTKEVEKENKTTPENQNEGIDVENDRKVAEEIKKFISDNEEKVNSKDVQSEDGLVDYQIEDNRSEVDDDDEFVADLIEDKGKVPEGIEVDLQSLNELADDIAELNTIKESLDDSKEESVSNINKTYQTDDGSTDLDKELQNRVKTFDMDTSDIAKGEDSLNNSNEAETTDNANIFLETEKILKDDANDDFLGGYPLSHEQSNLGEIVEQTKKILETTDDKLDENIKEVLTKDKLIESLELEEDEIKSFDEAYDDLLDHWDNVNRYYDKQNSTSDLDEEISILNKKVKDLTDDYENIDDDNLESLFPSIKTKVDDEILQEEPFADDTRKEEEEKHKEPEVIEYLHDALEVSDELQNPDAEMINITSSTPNSVEVEKLAVNRVNENKIEKSTEPAVTVDYEHLSESEYDRVMEEFKSQHSEDLNFKSEVFDKHVAPIHITIDDKPMVVTSPNYPSNYPTNNIIDWIFYGEGEGIEFNVTDFAVNGHLGDYLLVKPGGVDATGNEGLVFSYTLTSERQYRFMDVNRMFVRFEARPGMQFMRGFSFSVKLLKHVPYEPEPEPQPEPVIVPPHSTITLNLGGTTLENFINQEVEQEFRQIVADMATMYINSNNIEHGLNTTLEVTQIVSRALCFQNWPKFENCVEVKFGVPLQYEGDHEPRLNVDDLTSMWINYFDQDPFASRLRRLGITEYQVPNEKGVMMVWLVIAAGVVISVAMLAFALWRFSCFEDYTRMPSFSDTDSLQEKRNLDLYPTPHQTLPPLYSENEYKWMDAKYDDSTRVDMGGFANKNYVQDDLYDFNSDEDVIAARDSNKSITPRDIFV